MQSTQENHEVRLVLGCDIGGSICKIGCAGTLLSRDGIRRIAGWMGVSALLLQGHDSRVLLEALFQKAITGNFEVLRVFAEFGRYLGALLVTFANVVSPNAIALGGGLAGAEAALVIP